MVSGLVVKITLVFVNVKRKYFDVIKVIQSVKKADFPESVRINSGGSAFCVLNAVGYFYDFKKKEVKSRCLNCKMSLYQWQHRQIVYG